MKFAFIHCIPMAFFQAIEAPSESRHILKEILQVAK